MPPSNAFDAFARSRGNGGAKMNDRPGRMTTRNSNLPRFRPVPPFRSVREYDSAAGALKSSASSPWASPAIETVTLTFSRSLQSRKLHPKVAKVSD